MFGATPRNQSDRYCEISRLERMKFFLTIDVRK